jgi:hypothetical protein
MTDSKWRSRGTLPDCRLFYVRERIVEVTVSSLTFTIPIVPPLKVPPLIVEEFTRFIGLFVPKEHEASPDRKGLCLVKREPQEWSKNQEIITNVTSQKTRDCSGFLGASGVCSYTRVVNGATVAHVVTLPRIERMPGRSCHRRGTKE